MALKCLIQCDVMSDYVNKLMPLCKNHDKKRVQLVAICSQCRKLIFVLFLDLFFSFIYHFFKQL